ncbi:Glycosyltransferase involved in cell wall bisynthesis [Desulfacinum hydrothermale DSM 13146]|uniref:Glycosyltransferase involved in cell wall bisynthesis n=1 Tax=Desulfacinum hydrothermale DSM 13146 TaxID=1121390 RepID=A0A1W1XRV1_9BACT|nr:Glycosyltransferase involved in cell wall bisynthesis [Desulfacinum hydrothermale DSM 13146]
MPDFSPAKLIVSPSPEMRRELLKRSASDSVHIFSGFHAYPKTYQSFRQALRYGRCTGVFAEAGRTGGLQGVLRRVRYRAHALRWGRRLDFLLATGELGVRFYRSCGFPSSKIYHFGYFVDPVGDSEQYSSQLGGTETEGTTFNLLFVGRLIECKGVDILLKALSQLTGQPWRLNIVGEGPKGEGLRAEANRLKILKHIHWLGTLPNHGVRHLMSQADCLVLPGRYDGWGAVVNEALLAGTPVVVSDACGSSDLIAAPWLGQVFRSESSDDLLRALMDRMKRGPVGRQKRLRIRRWAEECISPQRAAQYLMDIIRFVQEKRSIDRPVRPWGTGLIKSDAPNDTSFRD